MNLKRFRHDDWIVYFSGDKWAPLGFSSWISLYTRKPFSKQFNYFVKQAFLVWDGETTVCYIRESERKRFGEKVVKKVLKNPKYIDVICDGFRSGTDKVLSIYDKKGNDFSYEEYTNYNKSFLEDYYKFHIQVKNVVDFLPKKLIDSYLHKLQDARLHAEPVFSRETGFIKKIANYIGNKSKYNPADILFCLTSELTAYWRDDKNLPDEKTLKERSKGCAIFFEKGKIQDVLVGKDLASLGSIFLTENKKTDEISGQIAFKGKVKGIARLVFDPSNVKEFNKGDILVAPWTRPEYLPVMNKAGAFVTDGGAILSHAAIVARELKKPCIISTKISTLLIKDGDLVEVDANKGIIKIIKKAN